MPRFRSGNGGSGARSWPANPQADGPAGGPAIRRRRPCSWRETVGPSPGGKLAVAMASNNPPCCGSAPFRAGSRIPVAGPRSKPSAAACGRALRAASSGRGRSPRTVWQGSVSRSQLHEQGARVRTILTAEGDAPNATSKRVVPRSANCDKGRIEGGRCRELKFVAARRGLTRERERKKSLPFRIAKQKRRSHENLAMDRSPPRLELEPFEPCFSGTRSCSSFRGPEGRIRSRTSADSSPPPRPRRARGVPNRVGLPRRHCPLLLL